MGQDQDKNLFSNITFFLTFLTKTHSDMDFDGSDQNQHQSSVVTIMQKSEHLTQTLVGVISQKQQTLKLFLSLEVHQLSPLHYTLQSLKTHCVNLLRLLFYSNHTKLD